MANKTAIIIGAGVAGPILALQLKKAGYLAQVFESRMEDDNKEGAFLGISPNGLNVLKEFVDLELLKDDCTPGAMKFFNSAGKQIAELGTAYQKEKYGAETFQIKRKNLNRLVRAAAGKNGIPIHFGKKFLRFDESENQVTAVFHDGTSYSADILVGCDGIFSMVRRQLFPRATALKYTKLISTGGYARLSELNEPSDALHMIFGERGFFSYSVSNNGEIWWFNNYFRAKEPMAHELENTLKTEIQKYLLEIHKNDDPLFSKIIQNSTELIAYPVYDVPRLPRWSIGRVCLLGDAAHGISPHVGQGASLALEDTVVLAAMLKKANDHETAFTQFRKERQPRVEKIVKSARKVGGTKSKPSAFATRMRDRFIGFFIRKLATKTDWIYRWKTNEQ